MNEQQKKELDRMTTELMVWMDRNLHPHNTIVITSTTAELSEGVYCNTNDDLVD